MALASTSAWTVTPSFWAMPDSVSPLATTYSPAPGVVVGATVVGGVAGMVANVVVGSAGLSSPPHAATSVPTTANGTTHRQLLDTSATLPLDAAGPSVDRADP